MNHPPLRIHLDKTSIFDLIDDTRTLVQSTAGLRVEVVLDDITWLQMLQALIDGSGLPYISRQRLQMIIEGMAPQQGGGANEMPYPCRAADHPDRGLLPIGFIVIAATELTLILVHLIIR
jgi:hypothetical protein